MSEFERIGNRTYLLVRDATNKEIQSIDLTGCPWCTETTVCSRHHQLAEIFRQQVRVEVAEREAKALRDAPPKTEAARPNCPEYGKCHPAGSPQHHSTDCVTCLRDEVRALRAEVSELRINLETAFRPKEH